MWPPQSESSNSYWYVCDWTFQNCSRLFPALSLFFFLEELAWTDLQKWSSSEAQIADRTLVKSWGLETDSRIAADWIQPLFQLLLWKYTKICLRCFRWHQLCINIGWIRESVLFLGFFFYYQHKLFLTFELGSQVFFVLFFFPVGKHVNVAEFQFFFFCSSGMRRDSTYSTWSATT